MEKGFAEADAIVERTYQTSQIQHTPLEPHVCYAHVEGGRLVLNCATQVPYHVRRIVSWVCGIPENKIHVIKERVGGGYGCKQDILVEDLTGYAAWVTSKPVYYRNTRAEEFYANSTRHPMRVKVKMGGKKDGTITALFHGGLRQYRPLRQPLPDGSYEQLLQTMPCLSRGQHGL